MCIVRYIIATLFNKFNSSISLNMGVFRTTVDRITVKGIILILIITGDLFANWLLEVRFRPVSERCSPEYRDFAVKLKNPQNIPGGSVKEGDTVYTPGSWWKQDDGLTHGCPCSIKSRACVRKCCHEGQRMDENNQCNSLDPSPSNLFTESLAVYSSTDKSSPINLTRNHFLILPSICFLKNTLADDYRLLEDGRVYLEKENEFLNQNDYCLEINYNETPRRIVGFKCLPTEKEVKQRKRLSAFRLTVKILSGAVNVSSLLVFSLLAQLQKGFGLYIIGYLAARVLSNVFSMVHYTVYQYQLNIDGICSVLASINVFLILASQIWQNIITYQILILFRLGNRWQARASEYRKRFQLCWLAWGAPLPVVAAMLIIEASDVFPPVLKPDFASSCWFNNYHAQWIYLNIPYFVSDIVNVAMSINTLRRIKAAQDSGAILKDPNSQLHTKKQIEWTRLLVKMCLLMGAVHIFVSLLTIFVWVVSVRPIFFNVIYDITSLRGIEIFLIFVCKENTLKALSRKIMFWTQ